MRIATLALVVVLTAGAVEAQAQNQQPPPPGVFDVTVTRSLLAGEVGANQLYCRSPELRTVTSSCRPGHLQTRMGFGPVGSIILVGPNRVGARSRLLEGVGYRPSLDQMPGELEWVADGFVEGATLAGINAIRAIPDFDWRVNTQRLYGTAILVKLDGDAARPCQFSLVIRKRG